MVADHPLSQAADRVSDSTRCKRVSLYSMDVHFIAQSVPISHCHLYPNPCRPPTVGSRRPPAPYYYRWTLSAMAKWSEQATASDR